MVPIEIGSREAFESGAEGSRPNAIGLEVRNAKNAKLGVARARSQRRKHERLTRPLLPNSDSLFSTFSVDERGSESNISTANEEIAGPPERLAKKNKKEAKFRRPRFIRL